MSRNRGFIEQYTRNHKMDPSCDNRTGYMCAFLGIDNIILVGYSAWNRNVDCFCDWNIAKNIAIHRAYTTCSVPELPCVIKKEFWNFLLRCEKYFKGKKFVEWVYDWAVEYTADDEDIYSELYYECNKEIYDEYKNSKLDFSNLRFVTRF